MFYSLLGCSSWSLRTPPRILLTVSLVLILSIHPEYLMHLSNESHNWRRLFIANCLQRMKIPKIRRYTNIIAILKPGKASDESASYRPISLLSVSYTLLGRLICNRLLPFVDPQLPREHACSTNAFFHLLIRSCRGNTTVLQKPSSC